MESIVKAANTDTNVYFDPTYVDTNLYLDDPSGGVYSVIKEKRTMSYTYFFTLAGTIRTIDKLGSRPTSSVHS